MGGARAGGDHAATPAGGRPPLPRANPAAVREAMEALNDSDGLPLEAGRDQAGLSSGDEAAPSPQDRREAGRSGRSGMVASRRGRPEAGNGAGVNRSAPEDVWRGVRVRSFCDGGGTAARPARPAADAVLEEPSSGEALEALLARFGRDRAARLRVLGLPLLVKRQKEWKLPSVTRSGAPSRLRL